MQICQIFSALLARSCLTTLSNCIINRALIQAATLEQDIGIYTLAADILVSARLLGASGAKTNANAIGTIARLLIWHFGRTDQHTGFLVHVGK